MDSACHMPNSVIGRISIVFHILYKFLINIFHDFKGQRTYGWRKCRCIFTVFLLPPPQGSRISRLHKLPFSLGGTVCLIWSPLCWKASKWWKALKWTMTKLCLTKVLLNLITSTCYHFIFVKRSLVVIEDKHNPGQLRWSLWPMAHRACTCVN